MGKEIVKQNPPVWEDMVCNICGSKIKAGVDCYYFVVKDDQKVGKIICLKCKDKFYPHSR